MDAFQFFPTNSLSIAFIKEIKLGGVHACLPNDEKERRKKNMSKGQRSMWRNKREKRGAHRLLHDLSSNQIKTKQKQTANNSVDHAYISVELYSSFLLNFIKWIHTPDQWVYLFPIPAYLDNYKIISKNLCK